MPPKCGWRMCRRSLRHAGLRYGCWLRGGLLLGLWKTSLVVSCQPKMQLFEGAQCDHSSSMSTTTLQCTFPTFPISTTAVWPITTSAAREFTKTALILHLWTETMSKVCSAASNPPDVRPWWTSRLCSQPSPTAFSLIRTNTSWKPTDLDAVVPHARCLFMPLLRDVSLSTPISLQPTHAHGHTFVGLAVTDKVGRVCFGMLRTHGAGFNLPIQMPIPTSTVLCAAGPHEVSAGPRVGFAQALKDRAISSTITAH